MAQNQDLLRADAQYLHMKTDIDIIDRENPASIINLVEPQLADLIAAAYLAKPELFELDDRELNKKISARGFSNSPVLNRLRLKFWHVYDYRAQNGNVDLKTNQIFSGVCLPKVFWKLMSYPEAVAWVMCPPVHYEAHMDEALSYGLDQMRLILEMPNYNAKGNPNTKLLDLKMKITQMIDMRKNGSFLMRSEQKNLHLNLHRTVDQVSDMSIQQSMQKLEDKLRNLKERDNANLTFVEQTILETSKEDRPIVVEGISDGTFVDKGNAGANAAPGFERDGCIEVSPARPSTILEPSGEEGIG